MTEGWRTYLSLAFFLFSCGIKSPMYAMNSLTEIIKPVFDQIILIHFDLPLAVLLILVAIYATRKKIEEFNKEQKKHLNQGQKKLFVHGILNAKGCVICHSPHATDYRFQLDGEINDLCVSCHTGFKGVKLGHPVHKHPVVGKKDPRRKGYAFTCTSCHNPHGSENRYMLIGDVRGGQVCVMCHDGKMAW